MSLKRQAIRAILWSAGGTWITQAISLLVFFVLARLLTPEAFGLVALANVAIALLNVLSEQGLGDAVVQREEIEPGHLDSAFWLQVGVSLLLYTIIFVFAPTLARLFDQPEYSQVLRWLSVGLIVRAMSSTQVAILRRELHFKILAIRRTLAVVAGGIVGIGMAAAGYGVWSLVGMQLTGAALGSIALWAAAPWRPKLRFSTRYARDLLGYGIYAVGFGILTFLNRRSDDLLIGAFLGAVALGFYTVAYRMLQVLTDLLISIMSAVALPTFSRVQSDLPRLRRGFLQALQIAGLVALPAFCWVAVATPDVIRVFGDKWIPATPVMRILALVGIPYTALYFNGSVFMALGRPDISLRFKIISATCNVIGFSVAVHWGILAVASMYLATNCLILPFNIRKLCELTGLRNAMYLSVVVGPAVASFAVVASVILSGYLSDDCLGLYARLTVKIIAGATTYLAVLRLVFPVVWHETLRLVRGGLVPSKASES